MKIRGFVTVSLAVVLVGATATPAHADWDFQIGTTLAGGWLRQSPDFTADAIGLASRDIPAQTLRSRGGIAMLGFGGDADLVVDDRWKVPLIGANAWWAVGSYPTVVTSLDGSIAQLRPWTTFRGDILLPGIGRRWKHRRYMFEAAIRTGVSWMGVKGSVAAGAERSELDLNALTFLTQVEVLGCRRLDPTQRVCIQVVPRIYEHQWLSGVSVGLRWEWGQ